MRCAAVQMNSQNDMEANVAAAKRLAEDAIRACSPEFLSFPENAFFVAGSDEEFFASALPEKRHPAVAAMREFARGKGVWLHLGSVAVASESFPGKCANRTLLIDAKGRIAARYDKIHLFDVELETGEAYRESARIAAGDKAVLVRTKLGALGCSICYDLRFPHLYRALAQAGAEVLLIPAAFTAFTGRLHWEPLLRARAIETGCFVVAAAQTGEHPKGRRTHGHSMIVDPKGKIRAVLPEGEGHVFADIDLAESAAFRRQIPSLMTEAEFVVTEAKG
jgi:predicted amidohydrolase